MFPPFPSSPVRLAAGLILWMWVAFAALAEHEADHRYVVEGYVLDAEKKPRSDVDVVVTSEQGVLGSGTTDRRGHYSIRLHLHNTDLGRQLIVKAGDQASTIEVTFDPGDRETERVHDLNFIGADTSQTRLDGGGLPAWWYAVFGAIIVFVVARGAVNAVKARRKALRREEDGRRKKKKKGRGGTSRKTRRK